LISLSSWLPYKLDVKQTENGMAVFRESASRHLIPVSPDNATSKDWVILLEAGTIVGPSPDKLRVARSTLDKKIVKRYDILLRVKHFLEVEG
jgi:hypothetical protein